jgi:hypothetical protein
MKKTLCAILTAAALTCALTLPVASQDKDSMKPAQAVSSAGVLNSDSTLSVATQDQNEMKSMQGGREQHPEIRAAMHHLEEAKSALEKAAHDFGGHRAKALEHVNQALAECNEALNFDKK